MKTISTAFIILLSVFSPAIVQAETLRFSWTYPPELQSATTGFRLYRDGNIIEVDSIPSNSRTVSTQRQTDKKSHAYMLTALNFETGEESKVSATALDVYVAIKPLAVEGVLQIEVLP